MTHTCTHTHTLTLTHTLAHTGLHLAYTYTRTHRIIGLDNGSMVEYDSPVAGQLLGDEKSLFNSMAKHANFIL